MEISFLDHWQSLSPDGKQALAARLKTSTAYLSQLAHNHRKPSQRFVDLASIVTGLRLTFPGCCED